MIPTIRQKQAREHNWYIYQLSSIQMTLQNIRIGRTLTGEAKLKAIEAYDAVQKLKEAMKQQRVYPDE